MLTLPQHIINAIDAAILSAEKAASTASYTLTTQFNHSSIPSGVATETAHAAGCATQTASNDAGDLSAVAAHSACRSALRANVLCHSIWQDYDRLATAAAEQGWTDDTPVPPSFFPPIADDEIESGESEIVIEVTVPAGTSASALKDVVRNVTGGMDAVHRGLGGDGITVSRIEITEQVPALVPTGGDS